MNPNVHLIHFSTFSPSSTNSHFIFNNNAFAHFDLNSILNLKKKTSQNTQNEDEASLWVVKVNMWVRTILT